MLYYGGNLAKALLHLFPDTGLDKSQFRVPRISEAAEDTRKEEKDQKEKEKINVTKLSPEPSAQTQLFRDPVMPSMNFD